MTARRCAAAFLSLLLFAQAPLSQAESLRVVVISDLNGSYGSIDYDDDVDRAVARIVEISPDLVIITGDMVAGQRVSPKLGPNELDAMWAAFMRRVAGPLDKAGIPVLPTPGNHDASAYPGFEAEREAYARAWAGRAPKLETPDGAGFPFRYAVSHGGALFVSLDATRVGPLPKADMDWLSTLLDGFGEARALTLFSHLPLWPVARERETEIIGDAALAALAESAGVDLWLSGHHHAYYPGMSGSVLHLAQACLGGGPRALVGSAERSPKAFVVVDIDEDGTIFEHALAAPDFRKPIDIQTLPPSIGYGSSQLVRRDLAIGANR